MAGLDQVDSISDPWEMLISSIWAYKCNTSSVCLTSQSGLAADLAPSSTSQVRFCPEATINSTCSASAHVFTCRPCSGFYCHHRFRSFLDAHLNAAIFQWALCVGLQVSIKQLMGSHLSVTRLMMAILFGLLAVCLRYVSIMRAGHDFICSLSNAIRPFLFLRKFWYWVLCLSGHITEHERVVLNVCD